MSFLDKTTQFLGEVKSELIKVNWPDQKSIIGSTTIVVITTVVMMVFLWVMDLIFSGVLRMIFR